MSIKEIAGKNIYHLDDPSRLEDHFGELIPARDHVLRIQKLLRFAGLKIEGCDLRLPPIKSDLPESYTHYSLGFWPSQPPSPPESGIVDRFEPVFTYIRIYDQYFPNGEQHQIPIPLLQVKNSEFFQGFSKVDDLVDFILKLY